MTPQDAPTEEQVEQIRARVAAQSHRRPYDAAAQSPTPVAAFVAGHGVWAGSGVRPDRVQAFAEEVQTYADGLLSQARLEGLAAAQRSYYNGYSAALAAARGELP